MKTFVAGVLATLVAIGIIFAIFPYTGIFDVAASQSDLWPAKHFLNTTMRVSVEHRASAIQLPSYSLQDPKVIAMGLNHFHEMCVSCHSAPGVERSEAGQGLNPKAPDLSKASKYWTPQQLFWIVKNGVKMTGMPEFGSTHSDDKIWAIVSFLERLPTLSTEEYKAETKNLKDDD